MSFLRDTLEDTECKHDTKYRAPYLALLELVWQMHNKGLQDLVNKLDGKVLTCSGLSFVLHFS